MKRATILALSAAIGLVALTAVAAFAATTHWYNAKGYVYYRLSDDVVTKKMFLQVRDVNQVQSMHQEEHFRCFFEDIEIHVPVSTIRSLVVDESGDTAVLTRRDGNAYRVALPKDMGDSLTGLSASVFLLFNEVSGEFEEGYVEGEEITRIEFVDAF